MATTELPPHLRADVETLWAYHDMGHEPRPCDVGTGLGSHDLGVAIHTAELYQQGMFPRILFTGANAPTTIERFPCGEAVHYREHVISLGVPAQVILIETEATRFLKPRMPPTGDSSTPDTSVDCATPQGGAPRSRPVAVIKRIATIERCRSTL
jgi:hypothetical protein